MNATIMAGASSTTVPLTLTVTNSGHASSKSKTASSVDNFVDEKASNFNEVQQT